MGGQTATFFSLKDTGRDAQALEACYDRKKQRSSSMRIVLILTALLTLAACDVPFIPLI